MLNKPLYCLLLTLSWQAALFGQDAQLEIDNILEDDSQVAQPIADKANTPEIFAALDLVHSQDISGPVRETNNNFDVREIEFGFSGYVDHFASATILFALHRESHGEDIGEMLFDIHEAFVDLYALPFNLNLRMGKMFIDAGRLNTIHRHDWYFTNAPQVHKQIMNDIYVGEGASDMGAELSLLMPWSFYQELKVGVFRGRTFGHSHGDGFEKPAPMYTARLKQFAPLFGSWGTEFGFSYLRYQNDTVADNIDQTAGFDILFRNISTKLSVTWASEFWYKIQERVGLLTDSRYGFFSYIDFKFFKKYHVGYRYDWYTGDFKNLNLTQGYSGNTVWLAYKPSEFSTFRINAEQKNYDQLSSRTDSAYVLYVQGIFLLGYHKPHRY